ncbi:MAG: leucine-rich repeat protein, partial [Muribaculaceae bacterium]
KQKSIMRAVLTAMLSLVAATASAHDFEVDGIYYNNNGDGTVSVTFKGSSYAEYLDEYTGDVVIPSSVTYSGTTYSVSSIVNQAFRECLGLKSVFIPNSITSISEYAFYYCRGLKSVTIPNSVTSIGEDAFSECSGMTRVDISSIEAWLGIKFSSPGSNPLSCASYLYLDGVEVKDLVIPNSVSYIADLAFYGCRGLTSVTIPNSVTHIGIYTFACCSGLTSITFPGSVFYISEGAFSGCSGLKSVAIPNSVTAIDHRAFENCTGLTGIYIPNSVIYIGNYAFRGCDGLKTIYYDAADCSVAMKSNVFTINKDDISIIFGKDVKKLPNKLFISSGYAPARVISKSETPPTCDAKTFDSDAYTAKLYVPSEANTEYMVADVWEKFRNIFPISNPITNIKLDHHSINLSIGNTIKLNTTITPSNPTLDLLYWSSDSPAAVVDQDGNVTGVCDGTATITADAVDGSRRFATCKVTVKNSIATSITLNPTELKLNIDEKGMIIAQLLPADVSNKTVEWSTSNPQVAPFQDYNDGTITVVGTANGTATITARTIDGSNLSATCVVTVGAGAVEGVDAAAARIYTANGNIIIAATEDGEAAVYDFTGRLIKSIPVVAGDATAVPVMPGCHIVKTGATTQSLIVK